MSYERCLALDPAQGEACGNLSNLYRLKNRFSEAETLARRALTCGVDQAAALNALGLALAKQEKFAEAENAFCRAQTLSPAPADILVNRANLAVDQLQFDKAWDLFAAARALQDSPLFRHHEALARLLVGDRPGGLALFDARLDLPGALRLHPDCPRWRGEDLTGKKLLLIAEQGFGDVIHFCRYAACLKEGELIWAVPENLVRLLTPSVRGTVYSEKDPLPVCDYYLPLMSLLVEATAHPDIPTPYLVAPRTPLVPQGKHARKIGIVWAGSATHERNFERSIPLPQCALLLDAVAADFYAPFIGAALEDINAYPIQRLDRLIGDFADTAALIKQMDLVITVDTAIAHLAGALSIPCFLLLSFCPDWRWGVGGDKTDLYPSLTLVRQTKSGEWAGVVENLVALLKRCF